MVNIEMLHNKKMVVAETVGFKFEAGLFKSVPIIMSSVVADNIETFQNQNMVVVETVACGFEADLFKSVQRSRGFGYHRQH